MNKKIALFALIFLIVPCLVYAVSKFVIQETEKLSLTLNASDPDNDNLQVTYSEPLDQNGEWQTNYGDAGEYGATITASDGESTATQDVVITVTKKEESPVIESYSPEDDPFSISEADSIDFKVVAKDFNNDRLFYEWFVDNKLRGSEPEFIYSTDLNDAGEYEITVSVSDLNSKITKTWDVEVNDVDIGKILDGIPDLEANENDLVTLNLPDLSRYGLKYTVSEPFANGSEWQTTYDDAGIHKVRLSVSGNGFTGEKTIRIKVNDVDRPPTFDELKAITVNEWEEASLQLLGSDPDGDKIIFSAKNMPNGSFLEGNTFRWTPNFDYVKADGFWDRLVGKIMGLSKNQYIEFTASAKDKQIIQNAIITVKNTNRAPVIEDIAPAAIKEGDTLELDPVIYDPDGDNLKVSYSGISSTSVYKAGFDDTGDHELKITASDGKLSTEKIVKVKVENTNRPPYLRNIEPMNIVEGDTVSILLEGVDPDGDSLYYDAENMPEGAKIKENAFIWTPSFETTDSGTKKVDIVFTVGDESLETRQIVTFYVENKNRPPKIIDTKGTVTGKVNKPVLMAVQAEDPDGNDLKYTWEFNFLEKYDATPSHMRIFTSKGLKQVKVIVSDGTDEVTQLINVNVV